MRIVASPWWSSWSSKRGRAQLACGVVLLLAALGAAGCWWSDGDCNGGNCSCPRGADCAFGCGAPPCHARCEGNNRDCSAVCANGTCTCGSGSSCAFTCAAPPCHVDCAADTSCSGECANGQCACGAGSDYTFTCLASPCHASCAAGASCVVRCPSALAGTEGCDIVTCAAGTPVVCPGGMVTTCGAPCP